MKIELIDVWQEKARFTLLLNEKIQSLEHNYTIVDIKYSTFYDTLSNRVNYSALILFKDKDEDKCK